MAFSLLDNSFRLFYYSLPVWIKKKLRLLAGLFRSKIVEDCPQQVAKWAIFC